MKNKYSIHENVVRGIVQVIIYVDRAGSGAGLPEAWRAGAARISEEAKPFMGEFVSNQAFELSPELIHKVMGGDWSEIWNMTNDRLKMLGYKWVKPRKGNRLIKQRW